MNNIDYAIQEFALGLLLVAKNENGVCTIMMGDAEDELLIELQHRYSYKHLSRDNSLLQPAVSRILNHIDLPSTPVDLTVDLHGSEFQRRVWDALKKIPPGQTASYTDIAIQLGSPNSARAVARACAANTLAIFIPCHRVIRSDGSLCGYRWGVNRKKILIQNESVAVGSH